MRIKIHNTGNFLVLFRFLVDKFILLDPDLHIELNQDPGGKMNADPDPQPCQELKAPPPDPDLSFFNTTTVDRTALRRTTVRRTTLTQTTYSRMRQ